MSATVKTNSPANKVNLVPGTAEDREKYVESHMNLFKKFLNPLFNFSGRLGDDYDRIYEERDYNDYASQVQRMQEAGLNPDLNGVSGYESDSANDAQEAAANQDTRIQNALTMIGGAVSGALSLYTGFAQLSDARVANDIDNFNSLTGGINEILGSMSGAVADDADTFGVTADEVASRGRAAGIDSGTSIGDLFNTHRKEILERYSPVFRSKRAKRMFEGRLNWYMNDSKSMQDVVDKLSGKASSMASLLDSAGDLKAKQDFGVEGIKEINELYMRLLKASNENQYRYQKTYGQIGAPENAAMYDADNAALQNKGLGYDVASKEFNQLVQRETLKTAEKLMKHDDMFSHFLASQLLRGAISVSDIANVGSSFVAPFGGALGKAAGKAAAKGLGL